jgi:multidrug efflux pump subunit AcrA (membrane-fusion protein)
MKTRLKVVAFVLVACVLVAGWLVYFHNAAIAGHVPQWSWLQGAVRHLGQKTDEAAADDEDPDNTKNEIPVHVAHVTTATLHAYVDGVGTVVPRPARGSEMAGSANVAPATAGVVAKVLCEVGQRVHAGDALVQLDDRLAVAALQQADASLAALNAAPRPEQLRIAELAVEKAQSAQHLAEQTAERTRRLAADQTVSAKAVQQAEADLVSANDDLATARRQLDLLKAPPTPETLRQEEAKVAAAKVQVEMMMIRAPIDAAVAAVNINPGEAVDSTKPVVQLIAPERLMVDVDVPADQLPANAAGLPVLIVPSATTRPAGDIEAIATKLTTVSPQVDPKTGAVMVGADLPPAAGLRAGQSVKVRIVLGEHKDVLAVPREAVVTDENGDSVIATVDGDQATHKAVKPGFEENGLVEVTADGLKDGDTVVTAGAFGLPQASRVKVVE